jgi:hypothetical protein
MSGISIKKATYGTGSSTVDVTKVVASKVNDGLLSFTVTTEALNVEDPAPGRGKQLDITYTINGGSSTTLYAKEGDPVIINAPAARQATGLEIIKAEYGAAGDEHIDVTDAVKSQVRNGSIDMRVGFKEVGIPDPSPTRPKELVVHYKVNGAEATNIIRDGGRLKISAPPVDGSPSATENGGDIISILIGGIFKAAHTFFAVIVVVGFYQIGEQFKMGRLFGGIAGLIILSSFFASPSTFPNSFTSFLSFMLLLVPPGIVFILRLFTSTDWVNKPSPYISNEVRTAVNTLMLNKV